jgi:uncharacterized lipoprotein
MKRLALLTVSAVLALFLSACGENTTNKPATDSAQPTETQAQPSTDVAPSDANKTN